MGMSPKTKLWVGYTSDIFEKLSDEGLDLVDIFADCKSNGIAITFFYLCDECVGIGAELLHQDWRNGAQEIDLGDLSKRADDLKQKVASIFKTWDIDDEPKVLLVTDYS